MRLIKIVAVLLVLVSGCAFAEGVVPVKVGMEAPDFELTTLDGQTFVLSENRGKVVLLNIWATWCPPCVSEMPDIQKLADAHPDELIVLGVSVDDGAEEVAAFVEAHGLTYRFAMDEDYRLSCSLYPTDFIPLSVFIDPNGVIAHLDVGIATYAQLEYRFQKALESAAEQAP